MTTKSDDKNIEEILGEKIVDEAMQLLPKRLPVAIYTRTSATTTHMHQTALFPNVCIANEAMDVSSWATTGPSGKSVFRLSQFICSSGKNYNYPINVIATAHGEKPFFMTVMHKLLNNGQDVEITVFGWNAEGKPATGVTFNWRCRVEIPLIIL